MLSAGLLLSVVVGSMVGLGWHALFGRRVWQLPLYWGGGVFGFWIGMILSGLSRWSLYRLGTVPLIEGLVGALLCLGLLWLVTSPSDPPRGHLGQRASRRQTGSSGKG